MFQLCVFHISQVEAGSTTCSATRKWLSPGDRQIVEKIPLKKKKRYKERRVVETVRHEVIKMGCRVEYCVEYKKEVIPKKKISMCRGKKIKRYECVRVEK